MDRVCGQYVGYLFKWIKQHLRIKSFLGVTENAVKTQIWIAVAIYVLVAIVKKRLNVSTDLYTILQVLSLTLLEKIPLFPLLSKTDYILDKDDSGKQRDLFENLMGH